MNFAHNDDFNAKILTFYLVIHTFYLIVLTFNNLIYGRCFS